MREAIGSERTNLPSGTKTRTVGGFMHTGGSPHPFFFLASDLPSSLRRGAENKRSSSGWPYEFLFTAVQGSAAKTQGSAAVVEVQESTYGVPLVLSKFRGHLHKMCSALQIYKRPHCH